MKQKLLFFFIAFHISLAFAQQLNDGPIQLQVRQREWDVNLPSPNDLALNVSFFSLGAISEDEYTFKVLAKGSAVNTNWYGGNCFTDEFDPSIQNSTDFNDIFYNQTFLGAAVPQFFDLRIDCHEDDIATDFAQYFNWGGSPITPCANYTTYPRCTYDASACCANLFGCLYSEGDDVHCDANAFKTNVNYRLGNPCEWYSHGFVAGGGCADNIYLPHIESFWRYTKGTACNDAINLGTLTSGPALTHFNSNVCYNNNFAASAGNDVFYSFTLTQAMGIRASLCGTAAFNTYMYLLDGSCNVIAFNDDFCNLTSEVSKELCAAGTYYVVVDGATAADMGTFTLSIVEQPNLLLDVNAGPDKVVCLGQTQTIGGIPAAQFGTGGYQYNWSPATGLSATNIANPNVTGLVAGNVSYILSVTDNSGCTIKDTLVVTVSTPPTAGVSSNTNIICSGASATLTGTGGSGLPAYQWLFNNGTIAGANFTTYNGTLPGNYAVVAYNALGCADTSSVVNIQVVSNSVANAAANGSTTICQGDSVFLNGYGIGLSYLWMKNNVAIPGATASNYPATSSGNYSVIMSFNGQCPDTSNTITVTVNPSPTPSISPSINQTICQGQSVSFTAGGGTSYQWFYNGLAIAGATSANYLATQSGNYYAQVKLANCSALTSVVSVTVKPVVNAQVTASGNTSFCQGQSVILVGSGNGAANQTLQWIQLPNTSIGNNNTVNISNSGAYQFIVNNNGCADTSNIVTVTVNTPPSVAINPSSTQTICAGSNTILQAVGGPANATYVWYQNGNVASNGGTANYTATNAGTYYCVVSDPNGCSSTTSTVAVNVTPVIAATIITTGNSTFCQGENVILLGSGTGGTSQTYSWLQNNNFVGNNNILTANQAGDYVFILNNNGCISTSSPTTITVNPLPIANISPTGTVAICEGITTTNLQATGGQNYQWYLNGQAISGASNANYIASTAGTYYATVVDSNNCESATSALQVEYLPLPIANIFANGKTVFCQGENVSLSANGGDTYQWLWNVSPLVNETNDSITVSQSGEYQVIVATTCGVDTSTSISVQESPLPIAYFITEAQDLFVGMPFRFVDQSINAANWSWTYDNTNSSEQNPNYTYYSAGTYPVNLTISNDIGCKDSIQLMINVKESVPFIPNAFTPNGDGYHDVLETNFNALKSLQFEIFDRWGNEVYLSENNTQKWDGKHNGKDLEVGTYYYVLTGKDYLGKNITQKGNILLMR